MALVDEVRAVYVPLVPYKKECTKEEVDKMFDEIVALCKERARDGFKNATFRFSENEEDIGKNVLGRLWAEGFETSYDKKLAGNFFYTIFGWA